MSISRAWLLSKTDYYVDFVVVPLVIAVSILLTGFNPLLFFAGYVIWSFAEYLIHRYILHISFRNQHWLHHIDDTGYVGVPPLKSTSLLLLLFVAAWASGIVLVFQGVAYGYLTYVVIHDAIHHNNFITPHIATLKAAHIRHHEQGEEVNFGVTTMFWDKLFRTYRL